MTLDMNIRRDINPEIYKVKPTYIDNQFSKPHWQSTTPTIHYSTSQYICQVFFQKKKK